MAVFGGVLAHWLISMSSHCRWPMALKEKEVWGRSRLANDTALSRLAGFGTSSKSISPASCSPSRCLCHFCGQLASP